MKKIGVIYVNSEHEGGRFIREAERSAASFKQFIPEADYILYTQSPTFHSPVFDQILEADFSVPQHLGNTTHKNGQMIAKLNALANAKHEIVLYLDSDTYALGSRVTSMLDLMSTFDIAAAHAPLRINNRLGDSIEEIPVCFPEFNCGVLLFRNTEKVVSFIRQWRDAYVRLEVLHAHDQGAFRKLLFHDNLRIATLAPEFNYRGSDLKADVVLLHNRNMLKYFLEQQPSGGARLVPAKIVNWFLRIVRSNFRLQEVFWTRDAHPDNSM